MLRFWDKVDVRNPEDCWEWQACRNRQGYGMFMLDNRSHGAHRVSFFLTHGKWPHPMCLHTCDNEPCVNPEHLYEGDQFDNMRDRSERGPPGMVGEKHPLAVLNDVAVKVLRYASAHMDIGHERLGELHGVRQSVVSRAVCGDTWGHVDYWPAKTRHHYQRLNIEAVKVIRYMHRLRGVPQARLASLYGVSITSVSHVVTGTRWAHVDYWPTIDA